MPRYEQHKCLNCGKPITWAFAICSDCERVFGTSPYDWPKWLRANWNMVQRERRRAKKVKDYEITFTDLEHEEEFKE